MQKKPEGQQLEGKVNTGNEWVDKTITRGGGSILVALAIWMNTTLSSLQSEVSSVKESIIKVTTELGIVSPKDLKQEVSALRGQLLTREIVESIVIRSAPWTSDKTEITRRITALEQRIRDLEQKK